MDLSAPVPGQLTLAVDLGGTNLRAALVDAEGRIQARHQRPTPHDASAPEALLELVREVGGGGCQLAVIGVPGRVDYSAGRLEYAPNLHPAWTELLAAEPLAAHLGLPVRVANDADLAAVGETCFGAAAGRSDVVYMTVSTGVGAGVLLGGRLVHGRL